MFDPTEDMDSKDNDDIRMGVPLMPMPMLVTRKNTSTGGRISTSAEHHWSPDSDKKTHPLMLSPESSEIIRVKQEEWPDEPATGARISTTTAAEHHCPENKAQSLMPSQLSSENDEVPKTQEEIRIKSEEWFEETDRMSVVPDSLEQERYEESNPEVVGEGLVPKEEPISTFMKVEEYERYEAERLFVSKPLKPDVKKEVQEVDLVQQEENVNGIRSVLGAEIPEYKILRALSECGGDRNAAVNFIMENAGAGVLPESVVPKKEVDSDCEVISVKTVTPPNLEDGDFVSEADWLSVGGTVVTAISTSKGRRLVDNEIVELSFPAVNSSNKAKQIVRFSTKRSGEIGRFSREWGKIVVPLVHSGKVKVRGHCIAAPAVLSMLQEIMLYMSFYIHRSILTEFDKTSWKLDASPNIDSTVHPLFTLFKLLKIQPYQKAEFTPQEHDSRKRLLNIEHIPSEAPLASPAPKRRKDSQPILQENNDEQAISESSLNKIVGAADIYDLEMPSGNSKRNKCGTSNDQTTQESHEGLPCASSINIPTPTTPSPSIPSVDEVYISARRKGHSTMGSASKRTRGLCNGTKASQIVKMTKKKIEVTYHDFAKGPPTKELSSLITHQIGAAIRSTVAMKAPVWKDLPQVERDKVYVYLSEHFNFPESSKMSEFIEKRATKRYAEWKYTLHNIYKEYGSKTPDEFKNRKDEWQWLVQHFESKKFKIRSEVNANNRDQKDQNHHSGKTPVVYLVMEHMEKGSQVPFLEAYKDTYVRPGEDKAIQNVEKMTQFAEEALTERVTQNPNTPREKLPPLDVPTQIQMFENTLGIRHGKEIRGLGQAGVRDLRQSSTPTMRARSSGVDERIKEVEERANARLIEERERYEERIREMQAGTEARIREMMLQMGLQLPGCNSHVPSQHSQVQDHNDDADSSGIGLGVQTSV